MKSKSKMKRPALVSWIDAVAEGQPDIIGFRLFSGTSYSGKSGITNEDAESRFLTYYSNTAQEPPKSASWKIFFMQLSVIAIVLKPDPLASKSTPVIKHYERILFKAPVIKNWELENG